MGRQQNGGKRIIRQIRESKNSAQYNEAELPSKKEKLPASCEVGNRRRYT